VLPSAFDLANTHTKSLSQTLIVGMPGKGVTKIIIAQLMEIQSLIKFSPVSRFIYGLLHFIANQLGDLIMQEPELPNIQGSGID
jgi:hypothetical protein